MVLFKGADAGQLEKGGKAKRRDAKRRDAKRRDRSPVGYFLSSRPTRIEAS